MYKAWFWTKRSLADVDIMAVCQTSNGRSTIIKTAVLAFATAGILAAAPTARADISCTGTLTGMINGLFFHDERWLGGYASWPRRMVRLGHIAFIALGIINILYALTIQSLHWPAPPLIVGAALLASGLLMPLVCYLSAWRMPLRHLFVLPVLCVLVGVGGLLVERIIS